MLKDSEDKEKFRNEYGFMTFVSQQGMNKTTTQGSICSRVSRAKTASGLDISDNSQWRHEDLNMIKLKVMYGEE